MIVHERRVVAPTRCVSCAPAAEPVLSTGSVAVHACRVKTGGETPACISSSFYPRNGGKLSLWTIHASLPCVRHMGSIIRYDKFEVFAFRPFFVRFTCRVDHTPLCTEACCEWSRCDAAAESNRRTLSCLGPRICCMNCLVLQICETSKRAHIL